MPRVHGPEVRSKAKAVENCRSFIVPTRTRLQLFRTITSVNQLSLYGAVAEMCQKSESIRDRTGKPVVGGQSSSSFVLSVIKTKVLLDGDDRVHKDLLISEIRRTN